MQLHDASEERLAEVIDAAVFAGKEALSVKRIRVRFGKMTGLCSAAGCILSSASQQQPKLLLPSQSKHKLSSSHACCMCTSLCNPFHGSCSYWHGDLYAHMLKLHPSMIWSMLSSVTACT